MRFLFYIIKALFTKEGNGCRLEALKMFFSCFILPTFILGGILIHHTGMSERLAFFVAFCVMIVLGEMADNEYR